MVLLYHVYTNIDNMQKNKKKKVVFYVKPIRLALYTIFKMLPRLAEIAFLILSLILIYSLMAYLLFQDTDEGVLYMPTYWLSLVNFYVLMTTANFPDVMMPAYSQYHWTSFIFISFLIFVTYFMFVLPLSLHFPFSLPSPSFPFSSLPSPSLLPPSILFHTLPLPFSSLLFSSPLFPPPLLSSLLLSSLPFSSPLFPSPLFSSPLLFFLLLPSLPFSSLPFSSLHFPLLFF